MNRRINFGKRTSLVKQPDLLAIQLESFKEFLNIEHSSGKKGNTELYKIFQEHFPISDSKRNFTLELLDYTLDEPRYSPEECLEKGISYATPLKVHLRLTCHAEEEETEVIEQTVFLGYIPYMTDKASFIVKGIERVIVCQIHRS